MTTRFTHIAVIFAIAASAPVVVRAQPPGRGVWKPGAPPGALGAAATALARAISDNSLPGGRWQRWNKVCGPIAIRGYEERGVREAIVWVEGTTSRAWYGLDVSIDSAGHPSWTSTPVISLAWGPPPNRPLPRAPNARAVVDTSALRQYIADLARHDLFSGAVIVASRGRIMLRTAIGEANRTYRVANEPTTRFALGSLSKLFTTIGIAQLVREGRLAYDDHIAKFIPDYPSTNADVATVGQLLSHAAGLKNSDLDWIATREVTTLPDLVALTAARDIEFPAGSSARYSNEGFLVAGRMLEIASGERYTDFVQQHILKPLGMTHTDYSTIDDPRRDRAVPYSNYRLVHDSGQIFVPGPRRDVTYLQGFQGTPAGGAYSTVDDLLRLVDGLRRRRLLDSAGVQTLMEPHARTPVASYGYGFELAADPVWRVGKGGNAQGTSSQLDFYPEADVVVIVLSNYDSSAQVAAVGIRSILGF
jgi:CubicO group peptidase (beta-lactamase class C family)